MLTRHAANESGGWVKYKAMVHIVSQTWEAGVGWVGDGGRGRLALIEHVTAY